MQKIGIVFILCLHLQTHKRLEDYHWDKEISESEIWVVEKM